ncbi:MAG: YggT family protein [Candidatus Aureabacteria bacterium]|nr:YggT family protein [Candidatus Auribacterota bacterium]
MANKVIHPLYPILLLLIIKAALFKSTLGTDYKGGMAAPLLRSFLEFCSFMFKTYLLFFWIQFSSFRYGIEDDLFQGIHHIMDRSTSFFREIFKRFRIRNSAFTFFISILLPFFVFYLILNLIGDWLFSLPTNAVSMSVKFMGNNLIEVLDWAPFLILLRIILSFFNPSITLALKILYALTEPLLAPFRRFNLVIGIFDFSPIVALIFINLLRYLLARLLYLF